MKRSVLKKSMAMALLMALLAASLSGCGGDGSDTSGGGGETKTIKFAHQFTEGEGATVSMTDAYQWVTEAAAKFEAEHEGYTVELEYIPGNDYPTKLMSDYTAGIKHDLIMAQSDIVGQCIQTGSLLDIMPYFSQWPEEEQNDFNWNPVWASFEVDGKLYGIPCGLHTRTIAYRKDMYEAAGLDPDSPPKTLDELVEYAQLLTDEENDVWGLGIYMGPHAASCEVVMQPLIWSQGGNYYDEATNTATFTTPEVISTIQWMHDCVYKYKVTPTWTLEGQQDESLLKPFLNGQFAMAFGIGNYWLGDLQDAGLISGVYPATAEVDDSKVGWFVVPEEGGKTFANAWGVAIAANSDNPDMAFELLTCAVDKEVIKNFIAFGGFPGRLSGFEDPAYEGEFWQHWLEISRTGTALRTPNYNNIKDSLTAAMQEIITSGDTANIEEVLQRYQDEYNNRYGGDQ